MPAPPRTVASSPNIIKTKIVSAGASGVGKTSILMAMKHEELPQYASVTIGVDLVYRMIPWGHRMFSLQIWDTAGQEQFRSIVPLYSKNARGALLIFDITNRKSFDVVEECLREVERGAQRPMCAVVVVGNKVDLSPNRQVSYDEGYNVARCLGGEYFEMSAVQQQGVENAILMSLASQLNAAIEREDVCAVSLANNSLRVSKSNKKCAC